MKTKIEIKSVFGSVLFSFEKENNTIKDTLQEAVRQDADLVDAYLVGADLRGADLGGADLVGAYLRGAYLRGAYLRGAYLRGADLVGAYLRGAYLVGADLGGADLRGADLRGADLRGAKNIPYIPLNCPSDGAFTGWKKVGDYIIELEIPTDARRLSSISYKCRCDKALVKSITLISDTSCQVEAVVNKSYTDCHYKVGELVLPDSFDEDRWNECSHGIHFFINKQDAINY